MKTTTSTASVHTSAEHIATEIRAEMGRHRITGVALAEVLGVTGPTMSRKLTGITPITVPEFLVICDHLGVRPGDLLTRAESYAVKQAS